MKQYTYNELENSILRAMAGLTVGALPCFYYKGRHYDFHQYAPEKIRIKEYKFQSDEEPHRVLETGFIGHGVDHTIKKICDWICLEVK